MRDKGKLWNKSWNPVRGCSARLDGTCKAKCWAASLAGTRLAHLPQYAGLTTTTPDRAMPGELLIPPVPPRWTGEVRFDPAELAKPLHWKKPRTVLLSLMGDLFDPGVTDEQIASVYGVMAACPQHTFLCLTKRADRRRYFLGYNVIALGAAKDAAKWPLPNVWEGVSVCDQADADARIPVLLDTPAAHRFVLAEPLLGPVDLCLIKALPIKWVICGPENYVGARYSDPNWIRSIVRQCRVWDVPVWVKGGLPDGDECDVRDRPEVRG